MNKYDLNKYKGELRFNFSSIPIIKKACPNYPISNRKFNTYLNSIGIDNIDVKKSILDNFVTCNLMGSSLYQVMNVLYKDMESIVQNMDNIKNEEYNEDSLHTYTNLNTKYLQNKAIYGKFITNFIENFKNSIITLKDLISNNIIINNDIIITIDDIDKLDKIISSFTIEADIKSAIEERKHTKTKINKDDIKFNNKLKRITNLKLVKEDLVNYPKTIEEYRTILDNDKELSSVNRFIYEQLFVDNINNIYKEINDFHIFMNIMDIDEEIYYDIYDFCTNIPTFFDMLLVYFIKSINNNIVDYKVDFSKLIIDLSALNLNKIFSTNIVDKLDSFQDWISDPDVISNIQPRIIEDSDDTFINPIIDVPVDEFTVEIPPTILEANDYPSSGTLYTQPQPATTSTPTSYAVSAAMGSNSVKTHAEAASATTKTDKKKFGSKAKYKKDTVAKIMNLDMVDYAATPYVYDEISEFTKNNIENSLMTSAFIGIGMPPLYHYKDDPGHNHFYRKMGARDANIVQIRPVVLDQTKREKTMDLLSDYVDGPEDKAVNPYLQKISFVNHLFSKMDMVTKIDELRTAGIDIETGRDAFLLRLRVLVGYTSKALGQNEIMYGLSNQYTNIMSRRGEITEHILESAKDLKDSIVNGKGSVSAAAQAYSTKITLMVSDYLARMMDNHNYLTFFSNTDISVSDSFSNSTKPFPEEYAKKITDATANIVKQYLSKVPIAGNVVNGVSQDAALQYKSNASGTGSDNVSGAYGINSGIDNKALPDLYSTEVQHSLGMNQLAFELYEASQHSKSLSISMKFISPYADSRQVYLYTMVPYFMILVLVLPQQLDQLNSGNILYTQVDIPGKISTDLGLVQSVQRSTLTEYGYNTDGMPLGIQVDISIQDLYNGFGIPNQIEGLMITPNFLSYINTILGFSREMEIDDFTALLSRIKALMEKFVKSFVSLEADLFNKINRKASNLLSRTLDTSVRSRLYNREYDLRSNIASIDAMKVRLDNSLSDYALSSLGFAFYEDMGGNIDAMTLQNHKNFDKSKDEDKANDKIKEDTRNPKDYIIPKDKFTGADGWIDTTEYFEAMGDGT